MLDVKQLRVLRAVAEHGSFSAAAEALSYTQPAISQQVAALERQTGTTLVDRTSRGVRLTDAGLEAMAGIRGGRVRLASFPTAGASILPPAIALFTQRHPEVELSFVEREPEEAARMLRAAELEVAIVFEYAEYDQPELEHFYEGIELQRLVDDPMYLALPLGHPAARKPHVRLRDDIVVRTLGRKPPTRRIAAATLAGRYRSPATEAMLGILEEVAARFELPSGAAVAAA